MVGCEIKFLTAVRSKIMLTQQDWLSTQKNNGSITIKSLQKINFWGSPLLVIFTHTWSEG